MKKQIKVLITDDHEILRQGLQALITSSGDIKVVAEAKNGIEAIELLEVSDPDVILMDIDMPVMCGDEAAKIILNNHPHIKIVILSMHCEPYYILNLLKLGIHGYLSKNLNKDVLFAAIRTVSEGGIFLEDKTIASLDITTDIKRPLNCKIGQIMLDEQEINLLKLICTGKTGKEISEILQISISTFNSRKSILKDKTGCKTDTDFVFYAIRHGLIKYTDN